jgi:cation diffusion facilitator CzcD-associated flavoprotein CzcO
MAAVVSRVVEADYLVVGAGAAGMAFTDALIANADVSVAVVERRHSVGGHWLDAYAFVRLHQASAFYGVASTLLGDGTVQDDRPEAGLQEARRRRRYARTTRECCRRECSHRGR